MEIRGLTALIQVFDMPRSVAFYRDVLGFELYQHSPVYAVEHGVELFHWCWLKNGDAHLMLNTAYDEGERPATEDAARTSMHSDISFYLNCPELDTAFAGLQAKGIPCKPPVVTPYGARQLSLRDPDGYGVVLQWSA
ncbi:VOC family protein [Terriglobus tenax]|uniref:VOC family protein n=1 Tax=Terriglobus tenax TaxID=1111115 RepID=UPI0021E0D85B|nr:VOC family protein [Terriglobus tenax]